jgi:head-tail adaptor
MLTSAELAFMRDSIEQLLPDTCNILSVTRTPDGQGGMTETWGTAGTAITCRVDIKQVREQQSGGAVQYYTQTMLSLPYDTTITAANRVEHGGNTYAVITPANTDQSWIAVKRVALELV